MLVIDDPGTRTARECKSIHTPHVYPRKPATLPAHSTHCGTMVTSSPRGLPQTRTSSVSAARIIPVVARPSFGHLSSSVVSKFVKPRWQVSMGCVSLANARKLSNACRASGEDTNTASDVICAYISIVARSKSATFANFVHVTLLPSLLVASSRPRRVMRRSSSLLRAFSTALAPAPRVAYVVPNSSSTHFTTSAATFVRVNFFNLSISRRANAPGSPSNTVGYDVAPNVLHIAPSFVQSTAYAATRSFIAFAASANSGAKC